jgi:hypothetical protein
VTFTPSRWFPSRYVPLSWTTPLFGVITPSAQVLTGILPHGNSDKDNLITDIRCGKRPSRLTDKSQNQWLQDRVCGVINTCWSDKPEQRYTLSVMHHIFLTPSRRDALVDFPPVGRENLIQLSKELLCMFPVPLLEADELAALRTTQKYIYNVVSSGGTSTGLSPAEVAASAETFHKVSFPKRTILSI